MEGEWSLSVGARPIFSSIVLHTSWLFVHSFPYRIDRWTRMFIVFGAGFCAWHSAEYLSPDDTFNEIYIRYMLLATSHNVAMAWKSPYFKTLPNHLEPSHVHASCSPWYRGWKLGWNPRGVGTAWENPYLWPGIKHTSQATKPSSHPDDNLLTTRHNLTARKKWAGIVIRCGYLLLNFFFLVVYYEFMDPAVLFSVPPGPSDYTHDKEGILRRTAQTLVGKTTPITPVTAREFKIRALQSFQAVAGDLLLLSLYHDSTAVLCLILGLDESWEWPPLYGSILQAYTMRRFWNKFWQRGFYKSASSHAALISRHVCGIQTHTTLSRIFNAFIVFGLSAIMHSMVETKLENQCAWGRSMWYWLLQPVAFLMEGVVQFLWAKVRRGTVGALEVRWLSAFERLIGYAWVCAWLLWVTPKHTFPLMTCTPRAENHG